MIKPNLFAGLLLLSRVLCDLIHGIGSQWCAGFRDRVVITIFKQR